MIFNASHDDVVVILAVSFAIQLLGLVAILAITWHAWRDSRRLTKATGALVLQEAEKIRALVRETSR
jgi:hypothetical protein